MHIQFGDSQIGLDNPSGDIHFLSHAHSDHTTGLKRKKKLIASEATLELAGIEAEVLNVPGCSMLDAGHILGARQLLVEGDGMRSVYTGDFSLEPNIFGWKAEVPECDHLIMEATYGNPDYVFPDQDEVYQSISRWIRSNEKKNLLIGAYELGKSQTIIKVLNENSIAPIVTEKTARFCEIYTKHGTKLDCISVGTDEAESALSKPFVSVLPMAKTKRYFAHRLSEAYNRETLCAVATGWAMHYRFDTDAAFPISDHADFNGLVNYVERSGARKVEFFCGDGTKVLEKTRNKLLLSIDV